jgi:hypothetical protein
MSRAIFIWVFVQATMWLLFGKKDILKKHLPHTVNSATRDPALVSMAAWVFWPILLVVYLAVAFIQRKQFRWLKKYWYCIAFNQLCKQFLFK